MSGVEAWVAVVDTEIGYTFTRKFASSPIRIGRALSNNLCLSHPAVAPCHGEISIGPRSAYFQDPSELVDYLVDPRAPESRLDDLDEELTTIAARLALDLGSSDRKHK